MITVSLPLLKLWFWVCMLGLAIVIFVILALVIDALTLRKRIIQHVDQWNKQREHFK